MKRLATAWIGAGLLFAGACAGPALEERSIPSVGRFPPFPARVASAALEARATFRLDHAEIFGADLMREDDVVPIFVALAPRAGELRLELARCELVLPDGSVLRPRDPAAISGRTQFTRERLAARSAKSEELFSATAGAERCLFFALEPRAEFHSRDLEVLHRSGDVVRSLDLSRALLVVPLAAEVVRVGIGVEGAPHAARASVAMNVQPASERGSVLAREASAPVDAAASLPELERALSRLEPTDGESARRMFVAALRSARIHAAQVGGANDTPHLVALSMYADIARRAADSALASPASDSLPADLREVDLPRELARLDWLEIAAHARLGFDETARQVLSRRDGRLPFEELANAIDDAALPPALEPWAFVAPFRVARGTDERLALRLAATALDRGAARANEFGELERWLEKGSSLEFHCPKCDHAIDARLRSCPNDQTPNAEFVARPRE